MTSHAAYSVHRLQRHEVAATTYRSCSERGVTSWYGFRVGRSTILDWISGLSGQDAGTKRDAGSSDHLPLKAP